ncbi:869_t:CDS:2, partial [Racocetra fulgida]
MNKSISGEKISDEPISDSEPISNSGSSSKDESPEDLCRIQHIRFKIMLLNEHYKSYKNKLRCRFNLCIAQIFISLIAIFIAKNISKIGPLISSLFVMAGTITTIFTVYLNLSSEKYYEKSGYTEVTKDVFKPMLLDVNKSVLK